MIRRTVVVGAGPIGLAAALAALRRGDDVTVLERGRVGDGLRSWGKEVRFFTPLAMNVPADVRRLVPGLPPDDALLTGPETADAVLAPLAGAAPLAGRVREGCRVIAIGRSGLTRGDFVGHPIRAEKPFRVLVENGAAEETIEADVVLDASGGQAVPNPTGRGGLPAEGERALGGRVLRTLGALAAALPDLAGKSVLLVGHGHSAAHAALRLAGVSREAAGGRVLWSVRTANRRPVVEVAGDPLPERARIASGANDLAESPPPHFSVRRRSSIAAFRLDGDGIRVVFFGGETARVDGVVSLTGARPDHAFLSELALEISPATEGTARLAASLARVTDCLSVPSVRPDDFETGERGFFFVGSKSYGRSRTFLLRNGLAHLDAIVGGA